MGHDAIEEARSGQLLGAVEVPGQAHLARFGESDALDQEMRAGELGHQPHSDEEARSQIHQENPLLLLLSLVFLAKMSNVFLRKLFSCPAV